MYVVEREDLKQASIDKMKKSYLRYIVVIFTVKINHLHSASLRQPTQRAHRDEPRPGVGRPFSWMRWAISFKVEVTKIEYWRDAGLQTLYNIQDSTGKCCLKHFQKGLKYG